MRIAKSILTRMLRPGIDRRLTSVALASRAGGGRDPQLEEILAAQWPIG
jgi:hypothetical protein